MCCILYFSNRECKTITDIHLNLLFILDTGDLKLGKIML